MALLPAFLAPRPARVIGLAVGSLVGALFVLAVGGSDVTWIARPAIPMLVAPILAAGALGGWLLGPMAWASNRRRDWVATALTLGIAAVFIGDAVTVAGLVLADPPRVDNVVSWTLGELLASFVEVFLLGLVFYGWFALPFTLAASAIWAAAMLVIRRLVAVESGPAA